MKATKSNMETLKVASTSQSWISWFLSFFNFFSRKESHELSALFNIQNNDDSLVHTLETFKDSLPQGDKILRPKIVDALENARQLKQIASNGRKEDIRSFINSTIEGKCRSPGKECIIPISTSLNGEKISSFLVIKLHKELNSGNQTSYQYSSKK
jgi:hypothetical protein